MVKSSKSVAFITLTNGGYLKYTLNCLKTLRRIGFHNIMCYAIGAPGSYPALSRKAKTHYIGDVKYAGFQTYKNANWSATTYYKFEIISKCLAEYDYVLYTDGDIVFKNAAFYTYCLENIESHDLLIQNDTEESNSFANLCTGFFLLKSNDRTRKYFDPSVVAASYNSVDWDDQHYVNSIKSALSIKLLPLDLFPNGRFYMHNHKHLDPYMIHFNWLVGHDKAIKMLSFGECHTWGLKRLARKEQKKRK